MASRSMEKKLFEMNIYHPLIKWLEAHKHRQQMSFWIYTPTQANEVTLSDVDIWKCWDIFRLQTDANLESESSYE